MGKQRKINILLLLGLVAFWALASSGARAADCVNLLLSNPGFEKTNPCWWWGKVLLEDDFGSGNFNKWIGSANWNLATSQYKSSGHSAHVCGHSELELFYDNFETNELNGHGWVVEGLGAGCNPYYWEPWPPSLYHWCYFQVDRYNDSCIYVDTGIAVEDGRIYVVEYYTGQNTGGGARWTSAVMNVKLYAGDPKNSGTLLGSDNSEIPGEGTHTFNSHEFSSGTSNKGNLYIQFYVSTTDGDFEQPLIDNVKLKVKGPELKDPELISDSLDTSGTDAIKISFWYRDDDIDDEDNVRLQLYDGSSYDDITINYPKLTTRFELGNTTPENTWHFCRMELYNEGDQAQYFHSNFRIKFTASDLNDTTENLWIDNVLIETSADITDTDKYLGNYSVKLDEEGEYCKYKGAYSWIPGKTYKVSVWAKALGMSGGSVDLILDNEVKHSIDSDTNGWEELTFQHVPLSLSLFYEDFENGLVSSGWVVEGLGAGKEPYYEGNTWQRPLPPSPDHWCYLQVDLYNDSAIYVDTGIAIEDGKTYTLEYYTGSNPTGWDTCILTAELWAGNPNDGNSIRLGSETAYRPASKEKAFNSHEFSSCTGHSGNLFIRFYTSKTAAKFEQPIIDNVKLTSYGQYIGNLMAKYNHDGNGTVFLDDWSICEIYEDPNILITNYHGLYDDANGLRNPERGFRYEKIYSDSTDPYTDWSNEIPEGLSLVLLYENLENFKITDLDEARLDNIRATLNNLRSHDMKCVLRFSYIWDPNDHDNPTSDQILSHIEQLRPIITEYSDVIYVWQAGFIRAYGEWCDPNNAYTWSEKAEIIDAILDTIEPLYRATQLRVPDYKQEVLLNFGIFQEVNDCLAYTDAPCAMIGFHNDGFLPNETDGGTFPVGPYYANPGNEMFDYMTRESAYVPVDGEMFYNEPNVKGIDAAQRMRLHHFSSFSILHGNSELYPDDDNDFSIDKWKKESLIAEDLRKLKMPISDSYFKNASGQDVNRSAYDYIRDHLGYRIELQWAAYPKEVHIHGLLDAEVALINRGFSAFVNPRPVYFLLIGENDTYEFEVTETDTRSWQPFKPGVSSVQVDQDFLPLLHRVSIKAPLPQGMGTGIYKLGLWLPDESSNLRHNPKYAVRVANGDVEWDNGINILGKIIISGCMRVNDLSSRAKSDKVQLTWTHAEADSYNVYRKTGGGEYSLLTNTTSTYSTYLDADVVCGTTYHYMVRCVCNGSEGRASNEVSAMPSKRRRR